MNDYESSPRLSYNFKVPNRAQVSIYVRHLAISDSSIHVGINNQALTTSSRCNRNWNSQGLKLFSGTKPVWVNSVWCVNNGNNGKYVDFFGSVDEGVHIFNIWGRESASAIDRVALFMSNVNIPQWISAGLTGPGSITKINSKTKMKANYFCLPKTLL